MRNMERNSIFIESHSMSFSFETWNFEKPKKKRSVSRFSRSPGLFLCFLFLRAGGRADGRTGGEFILLLQTKSCFVVVVMLRLGSTLIVDDAFNDHKIEWSGEGKREQKASAEQRDVMKFNAIKSNGPNIKRWIATIKSQKDILRVVRETETSERNVSHGQVNYLELSAFHSVKLMQSPLTHTHAHTRTPRITSCAPKYCP